MRRRDILRLAAGTAAAVLEPRRGVTQSYPARPVRVVVPFAPGGIADVTTRLVAGKLSEQFGKQFYIENIGGGSGNIGMGLAAKAAPDGYTMLTAFSSLVINPALFARLPYDPVKDFDPVSLAVTSTTVIVVNPAVAAATLGDLVALVRANPGKFTFSSAGIGTTSHLAGEQFRLALGLDLVHVPFTGGAPAMAAVVAGHVPVGFGTPTVVVPLIRDGRLRALAVTSPSRTQTLPEVATVTEAGYLPVEGESFVGFVVPAGTAQEIVALLNGAIVASMATADMKERQAMLGNDPVGSTPEEFAARIRVELATWARVVRAANIKIG
jgi:tripartite-type tricarboxylate transporter receptor subunit TctC